MTDIPVKIAGTETLDDAAVSAIAAAVVPLLPAPIPGPQGETGPTGPQGMQGPIGPTGNPAVVDYPTLANAVAPLVAAILQGTVTPPANTGSGSISTGPVTGGGSGTVSGGTVTPPPPQTGPLAISVKGSKFVDGNGNPVQLRGVNCGGLEGTGVHQWAKNADGSYNYWGDGGFTEPNWAAIKAWKANAVRFPLNSASWLGLTVYDTKGNASKADPATVRGYQAAVKRAVDGAIAQGLYVILDLHWSAPDLTVTGQASRVHFKPAGQPQFANADSDAQFWLEVATAYKGYPAVMFELFNEPYLDSWGPTTPSDVGKAQRDGGACTRFPNQTNDGGAYQISQSWSVLGFQQMTNIIRGVGAGNVVLVSDREYAKDLRQWLANKVSDPLGQVAAVWHAYPAYGKAYYAPGGTPTGYELPDHGQAAFTACEAIMAAGVPVILTETGGHNTAGTVGDPFVANVLAWVDKTGASVMGWTWDLWGNPDFVLVKDNAGTPTDGWGKLYHDWLASK